MRPSSVRARLGRSTAAHVGFAFAAMGGWAAFANRAHGPGEALQAGLVQGAISAAITLVMKKALEAMFARLDGPAAVVLPPLATALTILGVLVGLHAAAGTPEIWATIAVPYAVSTTYAVIYVASLARERRRGP